MAFAYWLDGSCWHVMWKRNLVECCSLNQTGGIWRHMNTLSRVGELEPLRSEQHTKWTNNLNMQIAPVRELYGLVTTCNLLTDPSTSSCSFNIGGVQSLSLDLLTTQFCNRFTYFFVRTGIHWFNSINAKYRNFQSLQELLYVTACSSVGTNLNFMAKRRS